MEIGTFCCGEEGGFGGVGGCSGMRQAGLFSRNTPGPPDRRGRSSPPSANREERGTQKKLPIVNSKSIGFSYDSFESGKPHSKRRGPSGENQRTPKPVEVRSHPRVSGK